MYEQEFDTGGSAASRPSLPQGTMAVFRDVLLRTYATLRSAATAVRTFGPVNTARAWLAGPLYRLRQAVAWGKARTGLPTAGVMGLGAFVLSDRGRALLSRGWTKLGVLTSKAMTAVGQFLVRHPLPAPVQAAASWAGQMTGTALAPARSLLVKARGVIRTIGVTARRGCYAFTAATVAKLIVPSVPAFVAVTATLGSLILLAGMKSRRVQPESTDTDPQGPEPTAAPTATTAEQSPDAKAAYASMEHLNEVQPKIRQAVKEAVASGDKEAIRDARRVLSACRARTGELRKAAAALRTDEDLPEELLPVLDDIDTLVTEMTAEWAQLSQQLRDATGNRGTRRAAASQARRQWSPAAAEAL